MITKIPDKIIFNKTFSNFLNKHEEIILKLLNIVKSFKNTPNTYQYSLKHPPLRSNYKYTDKLFIGCILYIILNSCSWISFIGPIPGKQVHKKFMEYSKNNYFSVLFEKSLKEYLNSDVTDKLKITSIDTTTIYNKQSTEIKSRIPYNKNIGMQPIKIGLQYLYSSRNSDQRSGSGAKRAAKISAITDHYGKSYFYCDAIKIGFSHHTCDPQGYGVPLGIHVTDSNVHDTKSFESTLNKILINDTIKKNRKIITMLADKGYDSKHIRNKLSRLRMKCIISYNKRNTKDPAKINKLTIHQQKKYKKRVRVEHYFGRIKRYPKVNCVYEKTLSSYANIVLMISSMMIQNKISKKYDT